VALIEHTAARLDVRGHPIQVLRRVAVEPAADAFLRSRPLAKSSCASMNVTAPAWISHPVSAPFSRHSSPTTNPRTSR